MKIYILLAKENWITDQLAKEWINYNKDLYTNDLKETLDSIKFNIDSIVDNIKGQWILDHEEFTYYLKILNIQDSIATAKITGSVFPFAYPQIGDEINIK